jgi:hypothetical protein
MGQILQNLQDMRELEFLHRLVPESLYHRLRLFFVEHICKSMSG